MRIIFLKSRKRLVKKLQNPRLMKVSFRTFRYWKGTTLKHQTKVHGLSKNFLDTKSIRNTERYITYEKTIYDSSSDEYTERVVKDRNEIKRFIEVGFEHVCEKYGLIFLRKRK